MSLYSEGSSPGKDSASVGPAGASELAVPPVGAADGEGAGAGDPSGPGQPSGKSPRPIFVRSVERGAGRRPERPPAGSDLDADARFADRVEVAPSGSIAGGGFRIVWKRCRSSAPAMSETSDTRIMRARGL